jgi:hypothetical protein
MFVGANGTCLNAVCIVSLRQKFALATAKRKWSYSRAGRDQTRHTEVAMPSLIKLLTVVGLIGALGYAAMFALATFVDPRPREMVVTVPPDRFVKQPH